MQDQKNLILAVVLSIGILIAFQVFFAPPPPDEQAVVDGVETTVTGEEATADVAGVPGGVEGLPGDPLTIPGDVASGVAVDREAAISADAADRITIATPRLTGSLLLSGARLDDLTLLDYQETVDPESPFIELLSPRQAPHPYYTDFGWSGAEGVAVPDLETPWQVTDPRAELTPETPVTLTWDNGEGLTFEMEVAVDADYMFTITQRVVNSSESTVNLRPYGRILRFGEPETLGFFILHEGPYGVFEGTLEEYSYDDIVDDGVIAHETTGGWLGFTDKYWLMALVPDQETTIDAQFSYGQSGAYERFISAFAAPPETIVPGQSAEVTLRLFAGAKVVDIIDGYADTYNIENFDLTIDFGWFYFLTKPFFYAIDFIYGLVGNFGVAILIFTVFIKLLFFPLANKSYKAMSKMKALQPEMMKIRERFKEDRQQMNMEMMGLYKREKVNPASGCLPILIQIPVFFALYKVLFVTIEMRHAPFFGWIQDLSAPDPTSLFNLFGLIPWDPPTFLSIGIWPLIMGITMFLQQKLNPPPTDPLQQKIFMALPIVFTFLLANFPAGLVIYWAWNNALSILQQWVIMRRMGVKIGGGMVTTPHAPPSATRKQARSSGKGEQPSEEDEEEAEVEAEDAKPARPAADAGGSAASRRRAAAARAGGAAPKPSQPRRGRRPPRRR